MSEFSKMGTGEKALTVIAATACLVCIVGCVWFSFFYSPRMTRVFNVEAAAIRAREAADLARYRFVVRDVASGYTADQVITSRTEFLSRVEGALGTSTTMQFVVERKP